MDAHTFFVYTCIYTCLAAKPTIMYLHFRFLTTSQSGGNQPGCSSTSLAFSKWYYLTHKYWKKWRFPGSISYPAPLRGSVLRSVHEEESGEHGRNMKDIFLYSIPRKHLITRLYRVAHLNEYVYVQRVFVVVKNVSGKMEACQWMKTRANSLDYARSPVVNEDDFN